MHSKRTKLQRLKLITFMLFLICAFAAPLTKALAQQDINLKPLSVRDIKVQTPNSKTRGQVTIFFELAPEHHAYIQQFKIQLESPTQIFLSEPLIEPVVDFLDPVSKKQKKGTEGSGTIISTLEIPDSFRAKSGNEVSLKMILTYQACTKDYCLFPTKMPIEATLYMSGEKTLTTAEKFAVELHSNFWLTLLIIFGAGILTSFTPCIFPMIPITLAVLGTKDGARSKRSGFLIALTYVMGIAATYATLGVAAAKTGALFGSALGHPLVAVALALIFIVMALGMYGFYEIKLPDRLTNKIMSAAHPAHNFAGAFLSGLIAGIVASPCVGPVLVSILAYVAKSQDGRIGFILLFVYALGLGQIFLLLGTFSHLFKILPKSGPWLNKTKIVFGTTMIVMALYVLWPVAKPYLVKNDDTATEEIKNYAKPDWQPYSESLLNKAIKEKRPVIIDFKADWCLACKELEYYTFSHEQVLATGKDFLWLAFDATQSTPELEKLKKQYEILGLPFVMFYDSHGQWRQDLTLTGFEKAEPFLERMKKANLK